MKFTLSWLKGHLDTQATPEQIEQTLTKIGLEVEEMINPAKNLKGFVTAKVTKCEMHPDSDHLHLIEVDDGKQKYQVVCGAPNCKQGLVGIFAPVGTNIPLYNEVLKVGKIRGVESFGMMCSEKELMLGDNHEGIIELDANTPLGLEASEVLNADVVYEINITPNRAECLGVRGIARDLAAAGLGTLKALEKPLIKETFKSEIKVNVQDKTLCPVYVGRYIKGVNNKAQSPQWMKDRLTAIGLRPISALVDITNYINYDLARPLHVFDADKLVGNVTVRTAKENEKFVSLEEKEYKLDALSLGICDDEGVQCLAGIMGGAQKGCCEDTVNVFLECALFNPENIARTGRKFQIDSDSRYRYERWVDPKSNVLGSDLATDLILKICGGEASEQIVVGNEENFEPKTATITPQYFKQHIGFDVPKSQMMQILQNLGFEVNEKAEQIVAKSPSFRGDINDSEDLAEEIVRMIGFDSIPAVSLPTENLPKTVYTPTQKRVIDVKHAMANRGLFEAVTWSFTDSQKAEMFRNKEPILLANPIASDLNELRPSLLPNLLMAVKNNMAKGMSDVSLFELGPVFYGPNPTEQNSFVTAIRTGNVAKKNWLHHDRAFDVFDIKADLIAAIVAAGGPEAPQITNDAPNYFHPGRSATFRLGKNVIASFGELHPAVLKSFGIKHRVVAFELNLDALPMPRQAASKAKKKLELSVLQSVDKDLAFVVDKNVPANDLLMSAKNADKQFITDARIFDVYQGENMPEGKKSVALSLTFAPTEKTFSDQDIENLMNKVAQNLKQKFGAELRDK